MHFLKKSWLTLTKLGFVLFLWTIMFIGAISLFSIAQKGTVYYGDRCQSTLNQKAIDYLNQDEIIAYDYELNCNTLYLDLSVKDDLKKEEIISLLIRISSYYKTLSLSNDTQATAKNNSYLILANFIDDGSISLSISDI